MTAEKIVEIVKNRKWQIQRFSGFPYYLTAAANSSAWEVNKYFGEGYEHFLYLFEHGHTQMFYDEADWDRIFSLYQTKIKTASLFRTLERETVQRLEKAEKATEYNPTTLQSLSLEALTGLAIAVGERIGATVGLGHVIEGFEFGAERAIEEMLRSKGITDKSIASQLIASEKPSFAFQSRKALWEIKKASGQDKKRKVLEFLKKWDWVENTYLGSAHLTIEKVSERAEALTEAPIFLKNPPTEKQKMFEHLGLSPREKKLLAAVTFCTEWHDERKGRILKSIEVGEPVMEEVARRVGIKREFLLQTVMEELTVERLKDKAFLKKLATRFEGFAIYATPHDLFFFEGAEYQKIKRVADALHETKDVQELKGVIAQRGKARGVVQVCLSATDATTFPVGGILVAPMTRPEYVTIMQKAAAIVTDEGGITSHAAIVAREMKKPCIIGTKNATKILKDGDIVEVDAEKGVVKILKNNGSKE